MADTPIEASKNGLFSILQLTVDLPKLQPFYHSDEVTGRKPLVLLVNEINTKCITLWKFDEPVVIVHDRNRMDSFSAYLEITKININRDNAKVTFKYIVEGVKGVANLQRINSKWMVTESKVIEY